MSEREWICRICGNAAGNEMYVVREMMFGKRETFDYFQCITCGCLQIAEYLNDYGPYYGDGYYSLGQRSNPSGLYRFLMMERDRYALNGRSFIGRLMSVLFPFVALDSLKALKLKKDERILDVGCGAGNLLFALREQGFQELMGVDPYLDNEISYENGLKIFKKDIFDVMGQWDLIMLHHALEHLTEPGRVLEKISQLLSDGGRCVIRIPVADSYAWKTYGTNWVQIDAPRHNYLFTRDSLTLLAESAGLKIDQVVCDSGTLQFWASTQYQNDIALTEPNSFNFGYGNSNFSPLDIWGFSRHAKRLNAQGQGDQAIFYLTKL